MSQQKKVRGIISNKIMQSKSNKQKIKKEKLYERNKFREKDSMKLQKNSGNENKNKEKN